MLGVLVLRAAGLATALRARESLNRGELPAQTMLEGLMMALAGGLLILPGFISDVLGLVLLLPFGPLTRWRGDTASRPLKAMLPWAALAVSLEQLGRLDEARDAASRALAIDPAYPQALEVQRRLDATMQLPVQNK